MPLYQVYPSPGGEATTSAAKVDLVAVHGLNPRHKSANSHAWDTWRTPPDPNGRLWLRDDLPPSIPDSRIFIYEYDSAAAFGKDRSTFVDKAKMLLEELAIQRKEADTRPLILLGHSLGGLLIKQALFLAYCRRSVRADGTPGKEEGWKSILTSLSGLVFFATPHSGGRRSLVSLGRITSKLATILGIKKGDDLFDVLDEDGIFSSIMQEVWQPYMVECKILSFWGTFDQVVSRNSAQLGLPSYHEKVVFLRADHRRVCKFGSSTDDRNNFNLVRSNIEELYERACIRVSQTHQSTPTMPPKPGIDSSPTSLATLEEQSRRESLQPRDNIFKESFHRDLHLGKANFFQISVGREACLKEMHEVLRSGRGIQTSRKTLTLHGMGGVGKTHVAIQYAREHQNSFTSVFFLDGSSEDSLVQSFANVHRCIGERRLVENPLSPHVSHAELNPRDLALEALEWFSLAGNTEWLLIYDNVDLGPEDPGGYRLVDYVPSKDTGSIIVTSRLSTPPIAGHTLRLTLLAPAESSQLLFKTMSRPPNNPDTQEGGKETEKLLRELDGLPLAITQTGNLLKNLNMDISKYNALYEESKQTMIDLLKPKILLPCEEDTKSSVGTTWLTSLRILRSRGASNYHNQGGQYQLADKLLHLLVYFDPYDIRYEFIEKAQLSDHVPAWFHRIIRSEAEFLTIMQILMHLSLVYATDTSGCFYMHRLMHTWLCTYIHSKIDADLLNLALTALAWNVPPLDLGRVFTPKLISHAINLLPRLLESQVPLPPIVIGKLDDGARQRVEHIHNFRRERWTIYLPLQRVYSLFCSGGKGRDLLQVVDTNLSLHRASSSPVDILWAANLHYTKAAIFWAMEIFNECREAALTALQGFETVDDTYGILTTRNLLGWSLYTTGECDRGMELCEDVLVRCRAKYGCFEHPTWAVFCAIINGLPETSPRRVRHLEAAKAEADLMAPTNRNALVTLYWLAICPQYRKGDRVDEAERILNTILAHSIALEGTQSPSATSLHYQIGYFYHRTGKLELACAQYKQFLSLQISRYGEAHVNTARARAVLAQALMELGEFREAEGYLGLALDVLDSIQDADEDVIAHRRTMRSLHQGCRSDSWPAPPVLASFSDSGGWIGMGMGAGGIFSGRHPWTYKDMTACYHHPRDSEDMTGYCK